jgi:hypothetical protein
MASIRREGKFDACTSLAYASGYRVAFHSVKRNRRVRLWMVGKRVVTTDIDRGESVIPRPIPFDGANGD